MKLFGRTGGYYLFWASAVYLVVGIVCGVYFKLIPTELLQVIWIAAISMPFTYPPLGRYFNLDVKWDRKMFDFLKKREYSNVVKFPEPKAVPYVAPPVPEPEPKTYYTFGLTSDNRLSFQMGYTTLTMNSAGIQNLIEQLEFFKNQLHEEE